MFKSSKRQIVWGIIQIVLGSWGLPTGIWYWDLVGILLILCGLFDLFMGIKRTNEDKKMSNTVTLTTICGKKVSINSADVEAVMMGRHVGECTVRLMDGKRYHFPLDVEDMTEVLDNGQ